MSTVQAPHAAGNQEPGTADHRRNAVRRFLAGEGFVAVLIVVYILAISPFASGMLTERNALNVMSNLWPLAIIVVGQTFVLILGGIDLAQAATINITNTFGALLLTQALEPALFGNTAFWGTLIGEDGGPLAGSAAGMPLAVLIMLLIGGALGALNGFAVARLGMPPFMVTLGTLLLFSAISVWMTRSENVPGLPAAYTALGREAIWGPITYPMIVALLVAAAAHFVLSRTTFGGWVYASGTNRSAAIISGVPYQRVVISAYMLSAMFATLGGILYSMRLGAGRPTLADDMLLDVIGAAVIGGISLFGGKGSVLGAFLGALFFVVLANSLNLMNLPFTVVFIVKGLVIVAAALLDVARTRILGGVR
ncbi:ABC transporter permease [Microcella flavibacter]|uniref:ABC transporter permease n=1 Tax=Microcella flavibacter TaxID=1804990 RepID=UPI0014572EF9|nr:ABC transporter permease [Microcella flavibacter]